MGQLIAPTRNCVYNKNWGCEGYYKNNKADEF